MQLLHKSTVLAEQIDSLGHMNVRYYMARMQQGNRILVDSLGIDTQTFETSMLRSVDTYTRFRREQFEGATLHTVGGMFLLATATALTFETIVCLRRGQFESARDVFAPAMGSQEGMA